MKCFPKRLMKGLAPSSHSTYLSFVVVFEGGGRHGMAAAASLILLLTPL
jgi:hypothetical protein